MDTNFDTHRCCCTFVYTGGRLASKGQSTYVEIHSILYQATFTCVDCRHEKQKKEQTNIQVMVVFYFSSESKTRKKNRKKCNTTQIWTEMMIFLRRFMRYIFIDLYREKKTGLGDCLVAAEFSL